MRRLIFVSILAACGGNNGGDDTPDAAPTPDAEVAPVFRNQLDLPDDVLAVKALELLGANVANARPNSCNECHGMTRQHLNYWRALSDSALTDCFTDLAVSSKESAKAMIECLRMVPDGESDFDATKAGIYATALELPWFQYTLEKAYGADAPTLLTQLKAKVEMPRGSDIPQFAQGEFDIVAEWFARGLPTLDSTLTSDPAPTVCLPGISNAVGTHVTAMATSGWRAVNKTNLMAMHNCGGATDPKDCFANKPFAADQGFGTGWDVAGMGKTRLLATLPYRTSFWTRSSPDGRFVGAGAISNAALGINQQQSVIYDLQRDKTVIIDALYDPAFFPDGSGFVFQGGARNTCGMSVLTSNPDNISMTEPACNRIATIGLYQHVGQALGGDYFTIDSEFVSDDGANQQNPTLRDPFAHFPDNAAMFLNPLVFNGTKYVGKPQVKVDVPFEGDSVLSPSARLIISRVANAQERQLGFVMRRVDATPAGASYDITTPEIARYCMNGGKPSFSFDERYIAYHHYVTAADAVELGFTGSDDPAFAPYLAEGAANVYLMELTTGLVKRVTNMKPGQYALFPHFRSDGWIYIQIRDRSNGNQEYVLASDAALLAE